MPPNKIAIIRKMEAVLMAGLCLLRLVFDFSWDLPPVVGAQGRFTSRSDKMPPMPSRIKREVRGALFLALGVGGICFFISLFILLLVGIFTRLMPLDIFPNFKKPMGWWEIGTLLVSF